MENESSAVESSTKSDPAASSSGKNGTQKTSSAEYCLNLKRICGGSWIDPARLVTHKKSLALGEGAFGTVKKCNLKLEDDSEIVVAVKTLKQGVVEDHDVKDLMREAVTMMEIKHPCIVQLHGVGTSTGGADDVQSLFLVFEYMNKGSLQDLLFNQMEAPFRKMYSDADAARWCLQIARAICFLHEASPMIIHRDLKPANILLKGENLSKANAKLTDFGLLVLVAKPTKDAVAANTLTRITTRRSSSNLKALGQGVNTKLAELAIAPSTSIKSVEASGGSASRKLVDVSNKSTLKSMTLVRREGSTTPLLHSNTLAKIASLAKTSKSKDNHVAYELTGKTGSLLYMAPEVFKDQVYNEKVDIFSFGMIMFELFMREPTFYAMKCRDQAFDVETYVEGVCLDGERPEIPSRVPPDIARLIEQCWSEDPKSRPSARQVVKELRMYMSNNNISDTSKGTGKSSETTKGRGNDKKVQKAPPACQCIAS